MRGSDTVFKYYLFFNIIYFLILYFAFLEVTSKLALVLHGCNVFSTNVTRIYHYKLSTKHSQHIVKTVFKCDACFKGCRRSDTLSNFYTI